MDLSPEDALDILRRLRDRFAERADEDPGARTILEAIEQMIAEREGRDDAGGAGR